MGLIGFVQYLDKSQVNGLKLLMIIVIALSKIPKTLMPYLTLRSASWH